MDSEKQRDIASKGGKNSHDGSGSKDSTAKNKSHK